MKMEIEIKDIEVISPKFEINDIIVGKHSHYLIIKNLVNNKYQWLGIDTGCSSTKEYNTIDLLVSTEFSHELLKFGKCKTYELVKSDKLKLIINK